MYVEIFVRFHNETSQALGKRFEKLCERLLAVNLREFGLIEKSRWW
ncbi:16823_t:CDS:2 [Dentiscutata heterogama]|uniref:16823_t:CDS:1 n=1 Tax=Dentiscutata heterogama TaxID=1316150 RepID=A0ACA9K244_9GLOM|nr:16823_t:CDS:2 [Dentiscutata heterogama]